MKEYSTNPPAREEIDALPGATLVEFGTPWCGHCRRAQPFVDEALQEAQGLRHIKVEDGPGRRLGRTFKVKLWPTLVFMKDGVEVARVVRPQDAAEIREGLSKAK